jgi:hypothetical protein
MSHPGDDTLTAMIGIPILAFLIALFVCCESWKYEECLKVGHSEVFCAAQTAGCLGRSR